MKDDKYINIGPHAGTIPVDDENCNFNKDTLQEYLEEICRRLKLTNPTYAWGRGGNTPSGTWLMNNEVPCNRVGIPFDLNNGTLKQLWVGNENLSTFDLSLYEHDGDEINLNLLTTVSVINSRRATFTSVDFGIVNIGTNKQLAVKVTDGAAKNPEVFAIVQGDPP